MNAVASQVALVADKYFKIVPDTTLPGGLFVPAFQVAQYPLSKDADGVVGVTGHGTPLVNINYHAARQQCADLGLSLITESQSLSLAYNLAQQARNWISGVVGEGSMYQGLHLDLDDAYAAKPFDFVSPDASERREFFLADDDEYFVKDVAGNVYTWVFDDVQGDENGIVADPFTADSPSITTAPYPSMEKGMGWQPRVGADRSSRALIRGGYWRSRGDAGVFGVGDGWPGRDSGDVGVRSTKPIGA